MTKQKRANVRWALSDAFVDNEVDYAPIARSAKRKRSEGTATNK